MNPQQVPVTHRDCYWHVFTGTLWILASVGTPPWMFNNVRLFDTLWSRVRGTWKQTLVGGLGHFLFFHVLGIVIPTDFHIFRGVYTTNQNSFGWHSRGFWAISHWEVHPRRGTPWDDVDRSADHPAHCHTCTVCEYMVCAHMEYLVYIYIFIYLFISYIIYTYIYIYIYTYIHIYTYVCDICAYSINSTHICIPTCIRPGTSSRRDRPGASGPPPVRLSSGEALWKCRVPGVLGVPVLVCEF